MSYLKKHWFNIAVGLISCGLAVYYFCTANIDLAIIWFISSCIWWSMSVVEDNRERIEELELKSRKYEALVKEVEALRELQQTYEKLNKQRFKNLEGKHE